MILLIFLSSCTNQNINYQKKDIEIRKYEVDDKTYNSPQIDGVYEVIDDTKLYSSPDTKDPYDTISKGSSVKVIQEEEDGFVLIDFFGNMGYIKAKSLKEI